MKPASEPSASAATIACSLSDVCGSYACWQFVNGFTTEQRNCCVALNVYTTAWLSNNVDTLKYRRNEMVGVMLSSCDGYGAPRNASLGDNVTSFGSIMPSPLR